MRKLHLERLANPQILALVGVLLINWLLFPSFFRVSWQDGRLFGSVIDVINRGAPVAILAIGMTGVIATKGVDLSVGAIMAVCGAVAATMVVALKIAHLPAGHPWVGKGASYEDVAFYLVAAVAIILTGPGKISLDNLLFGKKSR